MATNKSLDEVDFFPPKTAEDFNNLATYTRQAPKNIDKIRAAVEGYTVTGKLTPEEKDDDFKVTGTVVDTYFNLGGTRALNVKVDNRDDISGDGEGTINLGVHAFDMDRVTEVHSTP